MFDGKLPNPGDSDLIIQELVGRPIRRGRTNHPRGEQSAVSLDDLGQLAERLIKSRALQATAFPDLTPGDAGWTILLDLYVSHLNGSNVTVSSACVASGGPSTTALRHIAALEAAGFVCRHRDTLDRRRIYLQLTEDAFDKISKHLITLGQIWDYW